MRQPAGSLQLVEHELTGILEQLGAALLTTKAGHLPVVHIRRAAVRLVALDATVDDGQADELDRLDVVRAAGIPVPDRVPDDEKVTP